jgi:hypothetical protein
MSGGVAEAVLRRDRESGLYYHVKCRPGTPSGVAGVVFATF